MNRPGILDTVSTDLAELAAMLKARRRRRATLLVKRGQGPVLGLTAAVSASLVSAAAKEDEFDPLAGLVAVDDLSALAEICLPGEAYAEAGAHDHEAGAGRLDHDSHPFGAFYLADPFASPYAKTRGREHADHDGAVFTANSQVSHGSGHGSHVAQSEMMAAGAQRFHHDHSGLAAGPNSPAAHDNHGSSAGAESHSVAANAHASHSAEHSTPSAAHAGHGGASVSQGSAAAHHPANEAMHVESHALGGPAQIQVSAPIDAPGAPVALATPVELVSPADSHAHEADHLHVAMTQLDLTPADDLAASAIIPTI